MTGQAIRVVAYLLADGNETHEQQQLDRIAAHCAACGYELVGAARDVEGPHEVSGLISALQLVADGAADVVIAASARWVAIELVGEARRPRLVDGPAEASSATLRRPKLID